MNVLDRVSVKVEAIAANENNDEDTYSAFTDVEAKVFVQGTAKAIGSIHATLVNRQAIPENCFYEVFDEHSSAMEWVGCSVLENRYGRPNLQSLRECDDPEFDFMYISSFDIIHNGEGTYSSSDVASAALYKFLHDPKYIKGVLDYGCWRVSSAAYILSTPPSSANSSGGEANQASRKRKHTGEAPEADVVREQAEPFLRNGFFQEKVLVQKNPENARILIASYGDWEKPIRPSHKVNFTPLSLTSTSKPIGKDLEILEAVQRLLASSNQPLPTNVAAVMIGLATYQEPRENTTPQQINELRTQLEALRRQGGSIAKSTALHAACESNSGKVVQLLLDMEPAAKNAKDSNNLDRTPLMTAARNAKGRLTINGIEDTRVIDALLAAGADKAATDASGMTAYGYFRSPYSQDLTYQHKRGTLVLLESKLCPPTGPTGVDMAGGKGRSTGFVDYGPEDDQADREMGRGRWADEDEADY